MPPILSPPRRSPPITPARALALAGLPAADPRDLLHQVAAWGYRAVQLDATRAGLRPRELDRSARRDLASLLRRLELACAGVDLLIPPEHFTDPARADRAMDAATAAIGFTAELVSLAPGAGRRPALTLALPTPPDALRELTAAADRAGVHLADIAWPPRFPLDAPPTDPGPVRVALDPAAILLAGGDPAQQASRLGALVASARLSDISAAGRVPPGAKGGRLDVQVYTIALAVAGYDAPLVVDLRNVPSPTAAAPTLADS